MITIVNYGLGNLNSILNMLRVLDIQAKVSDDLTEIRQASKLILPGVGAWDSGMHNLATAGLVDVLNEVVLERRIPILGICLGMQLMGQSSAEGQSPGLGWLNMQFQKFKADSKAGIRVPHMGWNTVIPVGEGPLLESLKEPAKFYFVHSYHATSPDISICHGESEYGVKFPAIVGKGNILGVQFHPEKSHKFGMGLLTNFSRFSC